MYLESEVKPAQKQLTNRSPSVEFVDEPGPLSKQQTKRRNFSLQKADTVNLDERNKQSVLKVDARVMTPVNDQTDRQIIDSPKRRQSRKQAPVSFIESPNQTQNLGQYESSTKRNDSQMRTQAKSITNLGASSLDDRDEEGEAPKEVPKETINKLEDKSRLKKLNLNALSQKVGAGLQSKVKDEAVKHNKEVKLKVMTEKDIKKMKSQFSIFFDEPKSRFDKSVPKN